MNSYVLAEDASVDGYDKGKIKVKWRLFQFLLSVLCIGSNMDKKESGNSFLFPSQSFSSPDICCSKNNFSTIKPLTYTEKMQADNEENPLVY